MEAEALREIHGDDVHGGEARGLPGHARVGRE